MYANFCIWKLLICFLRHSAACWKSYQNIYTYSDNLILFTLQIVLWTINPPQAQRSQPISVPVRGWGSDVTLRSTYQCARAEAVKTSAHLRALFFPSDGKARELTNCPGKTDAVYRFASSIKSVRGKILIAFLIHSSESRARLFASCWTRVARAASKLMLKSAANTAGGGGSVQEESTCS